MIPDVAERIDEHSGSSSDSDDGKSTLFGVKEKTKLFGRKRSVHSILGGGTYADVMLWRDKQLSGSIFAGVTVIWLLFEWIGYHLITFICHFLILYLAVLFVWSNVASFIGKSPPKLADVILADDLFLCIADCLRIKINEAFLTFNSIASGKDLKKFLKAIAGLWVLSLIGSWFSFLTFFYIIFVVLYFAPVLYEKYDDQIDFLIEKAMAEIGKQYAEFDKKFLQKIPGCPFSNKKHN